MGVKLTQALGSAEGLGENRREGKAILRGKHTQAVNGSILGLIGDQLSSFTRIKFGGPVYSDLWV